MIRPHSMCWAMIHNDFSGIYQVFYSEDPDFKMSDAFSRTFLRRGRVRVLDEFTQPGISSKERDLTILESRCRPPAKLERPKRREVVPRCTFLSKYSLPLLLSLLQSSTKVKVQFGLRYFVSGIQMRRFIKINLDT